jgi:hypothetical protein
MLATYCSCRGEEHYHRKGRWYEQRSNRTLYTDVSKWIADGKTRGKLTAGADNNDLLWHYGDCVWWNGKGRGGEGVKLERSEGIGGVEEEVVHWGMSSEKLGLGRMQYAEGRGTHLDRRQ